VALDFEDPAEAEDRLSEAVETAGFEWLKGRLVWHRASGEDADRLALVQEMLEELS
jgi:hypothetical protein